MQTTHMILSGARRASADTLAPTIPIFRVNEVTACDNEALEPLITQTADASALMGWTFPRFENALPYPVDAMLEFHPHGRSL